MRVLDDLESTTSTDGRLTDCIGIGVIARLINHDLVDEVVRDADRKEKRSRLLPARVMVYYVLALCLFFGDSYDEVMRHLARGLRGLGSWRDQWVIPTTGAISKARMRLGEEPLRLLFDRICTPMAQPGTRGSWLRGWRLMAIDGVIFDLQDTEDNEAEFGRCGGSNPAPFPQARVAALVECGTHAVVAARIGPWKQQERDQVRLLLPAFEPGMLITADQGFYSYDLFTMVAETGADLLWRVSTSLDLPVVRVLPDGSYVSHIDDPDRKRRNRENTRHGLATRVEVNSVPVRVVEYVITNRDGRDESYRLVTTILGHVDVLAEDLAAVYHERWEIESTFDEIKTHQRAGSGVLLRSKHPVTVRQEMWALFLTHYAIRCLMHEAAEHIDIDPDRLSFTRSFRAVRRQVIDQAAFSPRKT